MRGLLHDADQWTLYSDGTTFNLLPLEFEAPANVSVALRLSVEAGIEFVGSDIFSATALAGAFINIPEITLGEELKLGGNDTCALPVFAEINVNAGVFVEIGADIGFIDLGEFAPTLSTRFFEAAVSTCVDDFLGIGGGDAEATAAPIVTSAPVPPIAGDGQPCPIALVTETTVTTISLTQCSVTGAINCPSDMAEVITAESTLTSARCPIVTANVTAPANATVVASLSGSYVPTITASYPEMDSHVVGMPPAATSTPCETDGVFSIQNMGAKGGYGVIALTKLATPVKAELVYPTAKPPSGPAINAIPGGARYGNGTVTTTTAARSMITSSPA